MKKLTRARDAHTLPAVSRPIDPPLLIDPNETWFSAAQLKARFQCSDSTLDRWQRDHGFPPPEKRVGRHRRWRGTKIAAWETLREAPQAPVQPPRRKP
jgi:predicted DNA-binding transcriptional regulator AlpA